MGGGDWDSNVEQLIEENEKLADAAKFFEPADTDSNGGGDDDK